MREFVASVGPWSWQVSISDFLPPQAGEGARRADGGDAAHPHPNPPPQAGEGAFCHAAFRVSSPLFQLHGHNSSVCSASRTRSTSAGLRPTEPSVTYTK